MDVLILSSSRGGSSVFTELLRQHPALTHLPGEVNPLLRLAGLAWPESGSGSDALGAEHLDGRAGALRAYLREERGRYGRTSGGALVDLVQTRLARAWPDLGIPRHAVETVLADGDLDPTRPEAFTRGVLERLQARYPALDPGLYDLPDAPRQAPVPATVLEEPPFILLSGWEALPDGPGPFVVKTPSNAYRLPFFDGLLPGFRAIHLVRNPAASINGLVDGWLHPGFHAHRVTDPQGRGALRITGYSDRVPGGDTWWKFDLPPGWEGLTDRPLSEVCAWQWASAHRAVLAWQHAQPHRDVLRVRFEDFLRDPHGTMERVCAWLGVDMHPALAAQLREGPAPRMATARPRQRRWFDRREALEPVLALPHVREVAVALGYDDPETWL